MGRRNCGESQGTGNKSIHLCFFGEVLGKGREGGRNAKRRLRKLENRGCRVTKTLRSSIISSGLCQGQLGARPVTPPHKTPGPWAAGDSQGGADYPRRPLRGSRPGGDRAGIPAPPRRLWARAPAPPAPPAPRRGVLTRRKAVGSRRTGGHSSGASSRGGRPHPSAPKIAISQQARQRRQPPRRRPRQPRPPAATWNPLAALGDTRPSPHPHPGHAPPPADPTPPSLGARCVLASSAPRHERAPPRWPRTVRCAAAA